MVNHKFSIWLVKFGCTASLQIAYVAGPHKRFAPGIASLTLTAKCGTYCGPYPYFYLSKASRSLAATAASDFG
jgi:hypothetical protein